jgi:arylsulfatase A-like enzyme
LPVDAYPLPYSAPSPSGSEIGLGATFPHLIAGTDTSRITASFYEAFRTSPFSNEALAVLAKEAINEEQLGSGPETDVLCISFSSTDYVGHVFGPNSQETLDMIVRTDRILADLFGFIDSRIGLRNCVIVLTSDHGITPVPEFLRTNVRYADAGRLPDNGVMSLCNGVMKRRFGTLKGEKWITRIISNNVYLNTRALEVKGLEVNAVARQLADSLMALEGVAVAIARQDMLEHVPNSPTEQRMRRSFHRTRSGDVVYALKPFYLQNEGPTGTGHGEPYDHDAHVPLIIVGDGIRSGTYAAEASPADIAPTLSLLLGIEFPAGREGRVLTEALKPR